VIKARGLEKTYPDGTTALRDIDLTVESGEMVFIRGRSGAGKTTFFRLLVGMEVPTGGALQVNGRVMGPGSSRSLRALRRKMGVIFQDFRLIEGRTALENVELGMRVLGVTGRHMRGRSRDLLERLGLDHRLYTPVESLSWGERQRVAAARALSREPEIVLADEPTGNLDAEATARVMELLYDARARGATVLIATHAADVLAANHERTITLSEGRVVADIPATPDVGRDDHA